MSSYDKDIPADPKGFTTACAFHMSYEHKRQRCGRAVYIVSDPDGVETPICRRYDTNPDDGYDGYFVEGCDERFGKWADAAAKWNEMRAKR